MRRLRQRSKISNRSTNRAFKPSTLSTWDGFESSEKVGVRSQPDLKPEIPGVDLQRPFRRSRSEVPLKLAVVGLIAAVIANPLFWAWLQSSCKP